MRNTYRLYTTLFILFFICSEGKCQNNLFRNNPNFKGSLSLSCQPIQLSLKTVRFPFFISSGAYQSGFYDNYCIFKLDVKKTSKYFINSLCDSSFVEFLIMSDDSLIIPEQIENRSYAITSKTVLKSNKNYYIIFFKDRTDSVKTNFVFCEYNQNINDPQGKQLIEPNQNNLLLYKSNSVYYQGKKSNIFDISAFNENDNFTKVTIEADFSPIIYGLNRRGEIVKSNEGDKFEHVSSLIINKKDSIKKICVQAYFDNDVKYDSLTKFIYSIRLNTTSYNPAGNWYYRIWFWFQDPLFSSIVATVVSVIISYIFFKKSEKKKLITYKELEDSVIINEDESDPKSTPIIVENEKLYKACLFKINFQNSSELRIEHSYVKENIQIEFVNMLEIIDLKIEVYGNGWKDINKISKNIILINFDFIDYQDRIVIKIIGKINGSYFPKGIKPVIHGRIAEVAIKEENDKSIFLLDSTFFSFGLFVYIVALPLMFLRSYFDVKVPILLSQTTNWIVNAGMFFMLFYFLFTKKGRRSMVLIFKSFKYSLGRLFA